MVKHSLRYLSFLFTIIIVSMPNTNSNTLFEGLSNLVYHFTSVHNILKIIEQDKLIASGAMANSADGGSQNRDKHFYISFQRSRSAKIGYAGNTGGSGACIEFDGQALNSKYKGTAIDYWQRGKDPKVNNMGKSGVMSSNELEDRLVLDTPYVPNIRRYIKRVHVTVQKDGMGQEYYKKLNKYCNQLNIPVYFYSTSEDFRLGFKHNALPLEQIEINEPEYERLERNEDNLSDAIFNLKIVIPFFVYKEPKNVEVLKNVLPNPEFEELYNQNTMGNLEYRYLTKRNGEYNQHSVDELKKMLYSEVFNFRTSKNPLLLEFSRILSKELRRYNANGVVEWVNKKLEAISANERTKQKEDEEKNFTDIIAIWQKAREYEYDDISRDLAQDYIYKDDLVTGLSKYIRTNQGVIEIKDFAENGYSDKEMKDILTLLKKYLKPDMIQHFLAIHDMRGITQHDKEMSRQNGRYRHLKESFLARYIKNFIHKQLM